MGLMWKRALLIGAVGLAAGGAVGCAEEREPIDRVQPNALAKSYFVGNDLQDPSDDPEFWTQGTVTDVGFGAGSMGLFTSTFAQPMSRIKWVVQENLLVGRITYERIDGTDGKGAGHASTDGVIAVAYAIQSHFDIRHEYNPTTGEEFNIVGENTTDRPWYEREYMRVDWSRNLNVKSYDFDTLSLMGLYGGVTYESLAYYESDPNHENAPHFDPTTGYFDVTNKAFATPKMIDLSRFGWGIKEFPACFLPNDFMSGGAPTTTCSPVELTIRQSFRRVVDRDYEPAEWDGYKFAAYGAFMVERLGYARNYGMVDEMWHRYVTRYNIWERSHYYDDPVNMTGPVACFTEATTPYGADPHRDENGDGTHDECESVANKTIRIDGNDVKVGPGSKCDHVSQKCTLPYRKRKEVPQAWYYTKDNNAEFYDSSDWATHEWDVALRSAVQTARYSECRNAGGDLEACAQQHPVYFGQMDDNADAVALAREVDDCRNGIAYAGKDCMKLADEIGEARGYAAGVIALAKMEEMLVLCHSPVEANDHPTCASETERLPAGVTGDMCKEAFARRFQESPGVVVTPDDVVLDACKAAITVRRGDLRYHQVNVIKEPQTPSPWGIYTDAEDPITGETIAASINVWSHVNDLWSQGIVDQLRYIKGELTDADVTEADYIRNWAAAAEAAATGGVLPGLSQAQLDSQIASLTGADLDHVKSLPKTRGELSGAKHVQEVVKASNIKLAEVTAHASQSGNRGLYEARRQQAISDPEFEAELTTPMMHQLAGTTGLPGGVALDHASPLRGNNPTMQREYKQMVEEAMGRSGRCVMHYDGEHQSPMSMTGMADVLAEKFGAFNPDDDKSLQAARARRMQKFLAQRAHFAVMLHEMGHSIGLRHNFVSSSDAWGYRPQYWQLRTNDGTVDTTCTDLGNGENCVGPRYFDPVTENERKNLIWMFMHSSTMDYAGEMTQDLVGLGAYDFAATRMFYGESVAVHQDPSYAFNTPRGRGMLAKMDSFGGIVGMQPQIGSAASPNSGMTQIHYSQLQKEFELIKNCREINPDDYRPASWNDERDGIWHPVMDGMLVSVNGKWTRCEQQKVDYVPWGNLRRPSDKEQNGFFYRGGDSIDPQGRVRVPYGFATDSWADLGNLSVYRHDNGADPYELFNFFISQQEMGHIFDNYRRGKNSFSVRGAAMRTLGRYNEKMRDGAKGIGLYATIYREVAFEAGLEFEGLWGAVANGFIRENILASGIAFDHFARQLSRPQHGEHFTFPGQNTVLRSKMDAFSGAVSGYPTKVLIPNGATGYYGNIGIGGKPLENALSRQHGDWDRDYTLNAGSYYDKAYTAMLFTESVDNFISSSRTDFLDPRYRSVSLADVFPEGYRRWLGNMLTGDDELKGPRLAADNNGNPLRDAAGFPAEPIGWTSWWVPDGPESCFPNKEGLLCRAYPQDSTGTSPFNPALPANTVAIDPQVGWEQQKFLIAWTLMHLPENQKQNWLNMLSIWEAGADYDPVFENRIEFHDPTGKVYVAKTLGSENIFGKRVQKSVGARILQWANQLLAQAYVVEDGPDLDGDGIPDWYIPVISPNTGAPIVKWDPNVLHVNDNFGVVAKAGCQEDPDPTDDDYTSFEECNCSANLSCVTLEKYVSIPAYMRKAISAFGHGFPSTKMKGLY